MKSRKHSKRTLPKKHTIMNHPILALILMPVWCMIIASIFGGIVSGIFGGDQSAITGVATAAGALLCLAIHRSWFRGEFDGSLKLKNFGLGMLLLLPSLLFFVTNLTEVNFKTLTPAIILTAFGTALGPGVMEEVAFRGLAGSNFMRVWRDEKKLVLIVTLTALLFGLVHISNILAGAGMAVSFTQAVYSFGAGVLFAAVYLRTGSLIPAIIAHTLVDASAFMNAELMESGGVLSGSSFDWSMLITGALGLALAVLGFWYIRPEKRAEILKLWAQKWTVPEAQELPAAEETQVESVPVE